MLNELFNLEGKTAFITGGATGLGAQFPIHWKSRSEGDIGI